MGGKKYFCDFCQVRIQNNPQIIKKHNEGLPHQKCKTDHYDKYKTLKEIIVQERAKIPCKRAATNSCAFGTLCRFSHYSPAELLLMEEQCKVLEEQQSKLEVHRKTVEEFLIRRQKDKICSGFDSKVYLNIKDDFLPPSLQIWDMTKVTEDDLETDWG